MTFQLSIRITHESINPDEISTALALQPHTTHRAGAPRKTPTGTPLEGTYSRSYWSCRLPEDARLSRLIETANEKLVDKAAFLGRLTSTGGRIEYFIGCFVTLHDGDILDWELLDQCARLKVNLAFDMYGVTDKPQTRIDEKHGTDHE
jgi:hypothetical protein